MNTPLFGATLLKTLSSGNAWEVGGVASSFHKDLDGDAIDPNAIQEAIPAFMAHRGPDGIQGGPIRLHHGFWDGLLKQAIALLHLAADQQIDLVASIALPLGRVTKIWVDDAGVTHWRGILSKANPMARTIWEMLKEGAVHLGVSVGGRILGTRPGRDRLGRTCTLISKVRLDELSITDNPALRLVRGESPDNGAYIAALSKSLSLGVTMHSAATEKVEQWLRKTLASTSLGINGGETKTGMGRGLNASSTLRPRGSKRVALDAGQPKTGIGGKQPKASRPKANSKEPSTDVYGITVKELTQKLSKCAEMTKAELSSPETQTLLTDAAYSLAGLTEAPPSALINFVRYLQYFQRFAQELPHMDEYQAAGTFDAMGPELTKALETFSEGMPRKLMESPVRPPGSPGIVNPVILFPSQYVCAV